jgi:hypothetical protein
LTCLKFIVYCACLVEDDLLALLVGDVDLHPAGHDDVERIDLVALVDDHGVRLADRNPRDAELLG